MKPFQPPWKKPVEDEDTNLRPVKKRRLDGEDDAASRLLSSYAQRLKNRLPLKSIESANNVNTAVAPMQSTLSAGFERFYTVLWRKPSTKKHKTWDGDGVLVVRSGFAVLQDLDGRFMGKIPYSDPLLPGSTLSVGGKEVEVDSVMSKAEVHAHKQLQSKKTSDTDSEAPSRKEMPISQETRQTSTINTTTVEFKNPYASYTMAGLVNASKNLLETTKKDVVMTPLEKPTSTTKKYKNPCLVKDTVTSNLSSKKPIPRHNPDAPGALIMKRPESVPEGKQVVDVVVDPILSKHLRDHQREGVKFLYECVMGMRSFNGQGAILADEMGLGKTLQTIALLWTLLKQNPIYGEGPVIKKALIVCPVTLINNWRKEFCKWLGKERIGVFVLDNTRPRLSYFTHGRVYSVMIVGYERLRTIQEELTKGAGVDIVIADEGHRLKTAQNKSAQAIEALDTPRRIILSGTPMQNDLSEFFFMVNFVNPGILGTLKSFAREFEGPIVKSRQLNATRAAKEKGKASSEELSFLTKECILRRTADILAKYLPPKTEYVLFCRPTNAQARVYREVVGSDMFRSALGNSEASLQLITILKKLCNSPSLLKPKPQQQLDEPVTSLNALYESLPQNVQRLLHPSHSAKIRFLDSFLYKLSTTTNEKVVLVSHYTSTLDLLGSLLASLSLPFLRLDGSTPQSKRSGLVDQFNNGPASDTFAFLLSAKSGGTGLNLIGASRLILFDCDWNPAADMQAMARIHRDGQKRHCRIYRLLLRGAIDERIFMRQISKLGLAGSVVDGKKGSGEAFSLEELRDLFSFEEPSTCIAHQLLGCECEESGEPRSTSGEIEDEEESSNSEVSDQETLIASSKVDMATQEARIKRGERRRKRRDMEYQSLMQYRHVDVTDFGQEIEGEVQARRDVIGDDTVLAAVCAEGSPVGIVFVKGD